MRRLQALWVVAVLALGGGACGNKVETDGGGGGAAASWPQRDVAEFETGTLTLAVMQSDAFGQEFRPHGLPIALRVADIAAAQAELEARGVQFSASFDTGVCHQAIFHDPDGNALVLHQRHAPRA